MRFLLSVVLLVLTMPAHAQEAREDDPLTKARAHWVAPAVIVWDVEAERARLHYDDRGDLAADGGAITGGLSLRLTAAGPLEGALAERFPHLAGQPTFTGGVSLAERAGAILRGQVAVGADGAAPMSLQTPGVIDALFATDEALGAQVTDEGVTVRLWAPTARNVRLHLWQAGEKSVHAMTRGPRGVWRANGPSAWEGAAYLYEVDVFSRQAGGYVTNRVTDPYGLAFTTDSERTLIVDLDDLALMPRGWRRFEKPKLERLADASVYELHVRDYSIGDDSVPEPLRGKFEAFVEAGTAGDRHLRTLAQSGLTHIHLLPAFDCATIPEAEQTSPDEDALRALPANSERQQAIVMAQAGTDGFNWCYDPFHYTAPEGTYAAGGSGPGAVRAFRQMVMGLADKGLLTVMDVVYNHTTASGQDDRSVLDKIVPGYYHRLNADGDVETSTCCANTATEHAMMERLMLDSLEVWARDYQVDGFRFDLMGHHSKESLLKVRDRLAPIGEARGVPILLYGEGWNFGEVANDARFVQASQLNMAGTGIGTFNDRLRDAVRGGAHDDRGLDHVRGQGFASGLFVRPNAERLADEAARTELLAKTDWVRAGLAGNLKDYEMEAADGRRVPLRDLAYGGAPVGYTDSPQENVVYVAAHDNETLFDVMQYKLPRDASPEERVRAVNLANSIVALSQGLPFFHAGQDMLRSKSLDRNSYDSGDWFNRLDWSYQENGWGRGLPPRRDNEGNWPVARELLADDRLGVGLEHIERAAEHLREMLRVRTSSPLFRLDSAEAVSRTVRFLNTGPDQVPGVIVMTLGEGEAEIVVIFNARPEAAVMPAPEGVFTLHPTLAASSDPVARKAQQTDEGLMVPALTTAVFVRSE